MDYVNEEDLENTGSKARFDLNDIGSQSFTETVSLSFKNFASTDLSNSSSSYFDDSFESNFDDIEKREDIGNADKDIIRTYRENFRSNQYTRADNLLKNGDIFRDDQGIYQGKTPMSSILAVSEKDRLDNISRYNELVSQYGLRTKEDIEEDAKRKAKEDFISTNKKLENTEGFTNGVAQMAGTMGAAMTDPLILATLPLGGSVKLAGAGYGAIARTAGVAAVQEMKIAALAEVPIQMSVYDWKKEIGLDYSVYDAVINGSVGILSAGVLRAGGSAFIDISPNVLSKFRKEAEVKGDVDTVDIIDDYVSMNANKAIDNPEEHIELLNETRRAIEENEVFDIAEAIRRSGSQNNIGKALEDMNIAAKATETPDDVTIRPLMDGAVNRPLSDINQKPMQKTGTDDITIVEKEEVKGKIEKKEPAPEVKPQNHQRLDEFQLAKEGKSDFVDAKYQEADEFLKTLKDDIIVPERVLNEDGTIEMKATSFKDEISKITQDENTINKMWDCAI